MLTASVSVYVFLEIKNALYLIHIALYNSIMYYTYCKQYIIALCNIHALLLVLTQVFKPIVVVAHQLISQSATLPGPSTSGSSCSLPVAGPSTSGSSRSLPVAGPSSPSSHSLPVIGTSSSPHPLPAASPSFSRPRTLPMAGSTSSVATSSVASIHPSPVAVPSSSSSPVTPTTAIHPAPVASLSRASTLPTITGFQVYFAHDGECLMY